MTLEGLTILVAILIALLGGAIGVFGTIIGSKLESNNVLRNYKREQLHELALLLHKRKSVRVKSHKLFIDFMETDFKSKTEVELDEILKNYDNIGEKFDDLTEQERIIFTQMLLHAWELIEYAKDYGAKSEEYYREARKLSQESLDTISKHSLGKADTERISKLFDEVALSQDILIREISKLIYKRSRLEKLIDW